MFQVSGQNIENFSRNSYFEVGGLHVRVLILVCAESYRPISLTCICCKLMEHVITSHIMQHADRNNILYPLQHGYRRNRSCETQLIEFIDDVTNNMASGKQTDVLINGL